MYAKNGQADGLQPIQKGRFVKEGKTVQTRCQPVATDKHPAANFAIAPFIGHRQWPQCSQSEQGEPQQGQRHPGCLSFGQGIHLKKVVKSLRNTQHRCAWLGQFLRNDLPRFGLQRPSSLPWQLSIKQQY
jgi:hypothetical protein